MRFPNRGILNNLRSPGSSLNSVVATLSFSILLWPLQVRAFDPNCVVGLLKQTNTGQQFVNIPNAAHPIVKRFLEPDGKSIKQSNIRPLKVALGLDKIQVAGYFDCPDGACGTKKISAHPTDADAEGQLSCPNCGTHVAKNKDIFYEGFDENGTIGIERLILEPDVVEKYSDKPLQRCDNCGTFNYQNSGNCGGCGAPPPKNPTYIQPKKKPTVNYVRATPAERPGDAAEAVIPILFIVGVVAGVVVLIWVVNKLPPGTGGGGGYSPSYDSSPSYDWGSGSSSSSYDWGGSSNGSSSWGGSSSSDYGGGGGSSNGNGTFDY